MSIIIKELFESDLDQYTSNWWSSKKIEKLNFNFDQIAISGGGPAGPTGFPGDQGPDGDKGPIGVQGPTGFQGPIGFSGADGKNKWIFNIELDPTTQIPTPSHITLKPNQFDKLNPTTIVIGLNSGTTQYSGVLSDIIKRIHTPDKTVKNIVFSTDENSTEVYLNLYNDNGTIVLEKSFNDIGNNEFVFKAQKHVLTNASDYTLIDDSLFNNKSINSYFGTLNGSQTTELKFGTKFNTSTPHYKWIAQADSVDGKIKWVNPISVLPGFPIGSVIGIRYEDFVNSNNFWKDETKLFETQYLKNRDGSGKADTQYEGWYLCNGEVWKKGAISFELPNLNSYSYTIQAAPGTDQGYEATLVQNLSVLSGADIALNIPYSSGSYSHSHTIADWNTNLETFYSNSNNTELKNSKIVYICFLGEKDLYWETTGYVAPNLYSISLSTGSTSTIACASTTLASYKVDFDPGAISWTNTSNSLSGYNLYNSAGTALATAGWYTHNGVSRYWSGTAFTQIAVCASYTQLTLRYSSSVYGLNGNASPYHNSSSSVVYADNSSLLSATKLYTTSAATTYAATGWYRLNNDRRFWSFTDGAFLGISISSDYIINLIDGANGAANYNTGTYGASSSTIQLYCNGYAQVLWLYTNSGNNIGDAVTTLSDVFTNYSGYGSEGDGPLILVPSSYYYANDDYGTAYARYSTQDGYLGAKNTCSTGGGGGGGGTGGGGGGGCVIEGTQIKMIDGSYRSVQDLRIGDILLSKSIAELPNTDNVNFLKNWKFNGEVGMTSVSVRLTGINKYIVPFVYSINEGLFTTSADHLNLVKSNGDWTTLETYELKLGDMLIDENGNEILIDSINKIKGEFAVYKLDVDSTNLYIAGNVLTHNSKSNEQTLNVE